MNAGQNTKETTVHTTSIRAPTQTIPINYSRGTSKYDNAPEQRVAPTFDDFEAAVLADRATQKGLAFVCAPLAPGIHYQKPDEYPGVNHWRLANYALPRTFLPFDFDGFASVESFRALLVYLERRYRGFGYTTASSTPEAPRARAILQTSRPVTRDEGKLIGEKLQAQILAALGADSIQFDESVYRGEQPVYTPVVTSETYRFLGSAIDVDTLLSSPPARLHEGGAKNVLTPEYLASLPAEFVIPDKIEDGSGREIFILRYAAHLRVKGLDQPEIARILRDYNAAHIVPPLDDETVLDRARRYESAVPTVANDTDWPEPEAINATLPPVPAFDSRLLPPVFRNWVGDIADRMQCPIEYLAAGAMVAAGAVVGNRIGVQPKRHDTGWVEVPNLWGAVVGRPGVMKSPALAQVLSPLRRLEADALAAFSKDRTQHELDRMQYEAVKKKIETDIKKGLPILPGQFPVEPEEPQTPRLLLNDSTYQKLGQVLSGNPHGLMVFQDEMSGLLQRLDSDGQEAARAFYLEAWNGQQSYTFDRIERGTVRIPRLCFSLLGGLQPSKLREYLRSAVYGGKGDDGLAQRLQLLVYPDISSDWTRVDRHPDMEAATAADRVFDRLASLDPVALGARIPFDADGIPVMCFSDEAQHLFNVWWEHLEKSLRQSEHHPALESHISKYRKLVPAMALLDHLILATQGDIQVVSLKRAILWQQFLLEHAKRAYAAVTSATMDSAKALSKHIQRGALKDGFTVREVYRHNWSLLSNTKEAAEAVAVLVDLGWLRAMQDVRQNNSEGRPTVRYFIHPRYRAAA